MPCAMTWSCVWSGERMMSCSCRMSGCCMIMACVMGVWVLVCIGQYILAVIWKSGKSPYLASVMSMPKYLLKCLAISSVAQPNNAVSI